jgi:hypothetical protein
VGCGLTLPPAALTPAALLPWLLEVLLALLTLSLALIGGGMHAGASAIGLGAGLVAIAAHGGAGLVASQPAGAFIVTGLVLDPSVAADQAVIAVAAAVWRIRPIVPVVGLIAGVVAVVVISVSVVIVVIAVPVDVVLGDVSVVVKVDVAPTTSTTPVHSPCSKAPASAEAAGNEAAPAKGGANRYPGAKETPAATATGGVYAGTTKGAPYTTAGLYCGT